MSYAPPEKVRQQMAQDSMWYVTTSRVWRGILNHSVTSVAASISFFVLLAFFPALAAIVTLVSLFIDPLRLDTLLGSYSELIPQGSVSVLMQQVRRLSEAEASQEQVVVFTPYVGFFMLVWSTNKGTKALFRGLNTIFDCRETRGFLAFTLATLTFTIGAIIFLVFALGAVLLAPAGLKILRIGGGPAYVIEILRWLLLLLIVSAVISVIYRFGPSREAFGWRSTISGSFLAATLWVASSALFSWYVSSFRSFVELYGSLSAVMGFMVWVWLSMIAVLIGAELDAALMKEKENKGAARTGEGRIAS